MSGGYVALVSNTRFWAYSVWRIRRFIPSCPSSKNFKITLITHQAPFWWCRLRPSSVFDAECFSPFVTSSHMDSWGIRMRPHGNSTRYSPTILMKSLYRETSVPSILQANMIPSVAFSKFSTKAVPTFLQNKFLTSAEHCSIYYTCLARFKWLSYKC